MDIDEDLCTMIFEAGLFIIVQNGRQLEITNNTEIVK